MRVMVSYVKKLLQSANVVVLLENQYMFYSTSSLGKLYQNCTRRAFQNVKVNVDNFSSTQLILPAEMGGLEVSCASLSLHPHPLPAFSSSAAGASDFITTLFPGIFEDVSFTKELEKLLTLANEQEMPLNATQKNWTQPVYVKTAQELFSRMDQIVEFYKLIFFEMYFYIGLSCTFSRDAILYFS